MTTSNMTTSSEHIIQLVEQHLHDSKAKDIEKIDLRGLAHFADTMIIASGTSTRHVASLAEGLQDTIKTELGIKAQGIEGLEAADWVLVDFGDTIIHIMLPTTRQFYEIEKLWKARPNQTKKPTQEQ